MAIERIAGSYVPVCDNCYKELCEQDTFEDAVEHLRSCGWATVKDEYGDWRNYCPECEHELLKSRYPSAAKDFEGGDVMKHLGDITKINGAEASPVNVIIGGSPCQDLSVAGKRAGLAGERSGLFMEQLRIIKEMRKADADRGRTGKDIRPRFMVWENVPGAFSSNKGADFGAVLQETIRVICEEVPVVPMPNKGWPLAGCLYGEGGIGPSLGEFLTLSFGEYPSVDAESHLSQILEDSPHPKYSLSAKACQGIIRRAERRGKPLPDLLRTVLEKQAQGD